LKRLAPYWPDVAAILLFILLPLIVFAPQTLGGRSLIPTENLYQYQPYATYREVVNAPAIPHNQLVSDLVLENYQWKHFLREQIAVREVPLWNPHQFSGIPFMAAGQHSGLYPVSLLYYVMDPQTAYGWYTVINLALAGAFMYAYLRGLGAGRAGATIAGVVYQLCGFVLASVVFQMMIGAFVWLPLLLLMSEWIMRRRGVPFVAILIGAGALGLNILAGHVEITLYTLIIVGYVSAGRLLWLWWHSRETRFVISRGVWLVAMIVLGFGVGAVQFIPLLEFVQSNWRSQRASLDTVLGYAHPMRDVLQFIMPNLYGSPVQHSLFDVFTGQTVTALFNAKGEAINFVDWGMKNYVEGALYVGLLPLLLTAYALTRRGPLAHNTQPDNALRAQHTYGDFVAAPLRMIYGSLALVSLTFMFGLPTYALMYALPGINQLNSPFRWIYAVTVAVCVFAAFGMDALLRERETKEARRWGLGMIAAAVLIGVGLVVSRVAYPAIESIVERVFQSMAKAPDAFANAQAFYSHIFVQAAIFAAMLLACGVVWVAITRRNDEHEGVARHASQKGMARHAPTIAAILLVALDLMIATGGFNPSSDPRLLDFVPPVVEYLQGQQAQGERFRFTTLEDQAQGPILPANVGWMYGLEDIRGYDSIIGRDYVDYMRALAPQGQLDFNRIAPLFTEDFEGNANPPGILVPAMPLLDLLNVRYIVTHKSTNLAFEQPEQAWTLVYEDEAVRLWHNPNAVPRAFLIANAEVPQVESGIWDYAALRVPEVYTPLTIGQDTGREKFIDVPNADAESWLIVSETWANGWRAFIRPLGTGESEEKPYPVEQVYGTLQGVRLAEGSWTVRLVYSPTSFQIGLFGSLISIAVGALMIGMAWWRRMVGSNTADSSTAARIARNSVAPIVINIFNRGIDFAFLLVMLRILAPTDVGTYYYLVIIFGWFDIFSNFGLDLFLIREIARDKAHAGRYFYQSSLLRVSLCVLGVPLLLGYIALRQATVSPPLTETALITLGLLYAGLFPASISKGMSALFYAHEQAETPAAIATITTINKAIFGVIVLVLGGGIIGLALVSVFNNLLTLGILITAGRKFIGRISMWMPDMGLLRSMIRESYPLLLNHFLATIFFQIDVIILESSWGAATVAQYSVAYRWILTIMIIPSFFTQALLPVMARQHRENPQALRQTYSFGIKLMFALAIPAAAFFTFFAVPLVMLMGDAQYLPDGAVALQLMIWSIPIGWLNSLTQYALIAVDLQRRITLAFVVAVSFNIIANLILIPRFGYPVAALTTILSELVLLIPFALLMQTGLHQRLNWGGLLWRQAVAGSVLLLVTLFLTPLLSYLAVFVGLGIYVIVLLALRPLDGPERELAGRILPRPIARLLG